MNKDRLGSSLNRILLILFPLFFIFLSIMIGSYKMDPIVVLKIIIGKFTGNTYGIDPLTINVLWMARLPRIFSAAMVGAALSVSGAVFQSLFKNPLASPYTLGVSNGAGFGAALGIVLSAGVVGIQLSSIGFGLLTVGITFILAARSKKSTVTLVLAGMLVGSLFASLVSLLKFVADPFDKLPQIVFWLMGSLNGSSFEKLIRILPLYLVSMLVIYLFKWKINILSMGDQEARSFGVNVQRDRKIIIIASSVLTALVVSISGIIGWVGIVIPHFARMLVGPDFRKIFPVSISLGIAYLVVIDDICRAVSTTEIPIGVITGILGAPLFIYFIYKRKVNW